MCASQQGPRLRVWPNAPSPTPWAPAQTQGRGFLQGASWIPHAGLVLWRRQFWGWGGTPLQMQPRAHCSPACPLHPTHQTPRSAPWCCRPRPEPSLLSAAGCPHPSWCTADTHWPQRTVQGTPPDASVPSQGLPLESLSLQVCLLGSWESLASPAGLCLWCPSARPSAESRCHRCCHVLSRASVGPGALCGPLSLPALGGQVTNTRMVAHPALCHLVGLPSGRAGKG